MIADVVEMEKHPWVDPAAVDKARRRANELMEKAKNYNAGKEKKRR